jgi:radical SAM superfamily enzyme YgiQ (UPF0313 family)
MRIAFVSTRKNADPQERELYEMQWLLRQVGLKRAFVDLGLLTVAACTPADVDTVVVDEYAAPIDYDIPCDYVALSAKTSCVTRAYAVADEFRRRGRKVILGGIHASLRPDEAAEHVDCVVTGEAEALWPLVVEDAKGGRLKPRYDAHDFPPMDRIPAPAWSRADHGLHLMHQLQTTRGCPFRCRFCSVPDISGQSFRFKPVDRVIAELRALPRSHHFAARKRHLYIVDDNFLSRLSYTKELLRAMGPLYASGVVPPWSAETTLNVAQDDELLDLLRDGGCTTLIVGFESISEATLADMDKPINFCLTFPEAVERIHRRGIRVVGNFIVGFDTDTPAVFGNTLRFIQQTGILYPFFSILNPMPGTALFDEFEAAGRLLHQDWSRYDTRHVVMQPKQMTGEELSDGYIWLYEQSYKSSLLTERLEANWRRAPVEQGGRGLAEKGFLAARLAIEGRNADGATRALYREGMRLLLARGLHGNVGNLLTLFDATDFATFMGRYKSANYERNARMFGGGDAVADPQWQNARAKARTERRAAS